MAVFLFCLIGIGRVTEVGVLKTLVADLEFLRELESRILAGAESPSSFSAPKDAVDTFEIKFLAVLQAKLANDHNTAGKF